MIIVIMIINMRIKIHIYIQIYAFNILDHQVNYDDRGSS